MSLDCHEWIKSGVIQFRTDKLAGKYIKDDIKDNIQDNFQDHIQDDILNDVNSAYVGVKEYELAKQELYIEGPTVMIYVMGFGILVGSLFLLTILISLILNWCQDCQEKRICKMGKDIERGSVDKVNDVNNVNDVNDVNDVFDFDESYGIFELFVEK